MTTRDSLLAALAVLVLGLGGCGQKTATTEQPASPTTSAPAPSPDPPAAQEQRPSSEPATQAAPRPASATPSAQSPSSTPAPTAADFTDEPALKDVFFDPGRADIGRNGLRLMKDNARWILENPGNLVLIEGHTDYKGTPVANLAMSERRAKAVVSFLLKEGVPDTRLWTIGHGSEQPVCPEKTEACAAKNRRVHFKVKKQ